MELTQLMKHPELMNKETLYDLRSLLALHPYYQTARLLMLQNLYLLHDSNFDEELRKAAIYITDRKVIFNLVEAAHYQLNTTRQENSKEKPKDNSQGSRTISLIDTFLDSIPKTEEETASPKRKPTPADAAVDYVSYLLEVEEEKPHSDEQLPQLKGQNLIDDFINQEGKKIQLKEEPEYVPQINEENEQQEDGDEGYFTETLAKIYIKQGRYSRALEIIQRLNLNYPKKNAYFADQIRFLEKLIRNSEKK
ncbi:MAG: tetratricopeptide repeat protein [Prevotella sp.]|nr:tetratricopeptide repeat protein [Prevotella sp.]